MIRASVKIEMASIEITLDCPHNDNIEALRQLHEFMRMNVYNHFYGNKTSENLDREVENFINKSIGLVYLLAHLNVKVI